MIIYGMSIREQLHTAHPRNSIDWTCPYHITIDVELNLICLCTAFRYSWESSHIESIITTLKGLDSLLTSTLLREVCVWKLQRMQNMIEVSWVWISTINIKYVVTVNKMKRCVWKKKLKYLRSAYVQAQQSLSKMQ